MSGLPIFADPSAVAVYHTVPGSTAGSGSDSGVGSQAQQQLPASTVAMSIVQSNPQRQDTLSNIPLPPGMEIVLGDKKYKIQYQSYEMTREKANEYIAKCTGTPYSRMSAPPDPEAYYGVAGASRGDSRGVIGDTSVPTGGLEMDAKPAAILTTMMGDRGTSRMSTTNTTAASGLPSESIRGVALSQQQQQHLPQHLPRVPEHQAATPAYAPPPKEATNDQQNQGYYWEDGVWKVWQGDSGQTASATPADSTAARKPPPPHSVQQNQPPQPSYPSQQQIERPKYDTQYQQLYQHHQQSQQQSQLPQPQTLFAATTTREQSPYIPTYSQTQQQSALPPIIRGPPPQPLNLLQRQPSSSSSNAGPDPTVTRYI